MCPDVHQSASVMRVSVPGDRTPCVPRPRVRYIVPLSLAPPVLPPARPVSPRS